jgi:hypothetical protein
MSLEHSIQDIVDRLADWGGFPKYSLERRVDIFLTPFLASFLGWKLNGEATLIAPEFPLLASRKDSSPPPPDSAEWTAHTVNVDYLLYLRRLVPRESAWLLVELKTDGSPCRDKQDLTYWNAIQGPMSDLLADIDRVAERTAQRHEPKYLKLKAALAAGDTSTERLELAYLGPRPKNQPKPSFLADTAPEDDRRDRVHFLSLGALANQPDEVVPPEHRALWRHVKRLLEHIEPDEHVRRGR